MRYFLASIFASIMFSGCMTEAKTDHTITTYVDDSCSVGRITNHTGTNNAPVQTAIAEDSILVFPVGWIVSDGYSTYDPAAHRRMTSIAILGESRQYDSLPLNQIKWIPRVTFGNQPGVQGGINHYFRYDGCIEG